MKQHGFSLLEILISVSIIAILLALALPTYSQYHVRAKRMTAEIYLTKLAAALEQHYITTHSYKNINLDDLHIESPQQYQVEIASATNTTFSLAAHPFAEQAEKDKECATLTLNSNGEKGITGFSHIEECW